MVSFAKLGAEIWRLFAVDGNPGSGAHEVIKTDMQAWMGTVEGALTAPTAPEILSADKTIFVRTDATGDTGRDGSSDTVASAFLTWQAAANFAVATYNFNRKRVTIRAGGSGIRTWSAAQIINVPNWVGGGELRFQGDTGVKDNVRLDATGSACIALDQGAYDGIITFLGFRISCSGGSGFAHRGNGRVHFVGYMYFVNCASRMISLFNDNAYLSIDTGQTCEFDGTAPGGPILVDTGTLHFNGTLLITGTRTYDPLFEVNFGGFCYVGIIDHSTISTPPYFTGRSYKIRDNGCLRWASGSFGEAAMGGSLTGEVEGGEFMDGFNGVARLPPWVPVAWGYITFPGGLGDLTNGYGLNGGIVIESTGVIRLQFAQIFGLDHLMANANYGIQATLAGTAVGRIAAERISTLQFRIRMLDASGAAANLPFTVSVYGIKAPLGPVPV